MLLEMVCSHSFLYLSSPSSQETQISREGKPQMTLVHVIAKSGDCLKRKVLTLGAWPHFSTYSSTARVTNNDSYYRTGCMGCPLRDAASLSLTLCLWS